MKKKFSANVTILGAPGSGKGTQAKNLVKEFGLVHISTGDLFRERAQGKDSFALQIRQLIDNGALVPDEITIRLLSETIEKYPSNKRFIFDGFPRNLVQTHAFEGFLAKKFPGIDNRLIYLAVQEHELKDRILGKRAKEEERKDDTEEKVQKRITTFKEKTMPVVKHYLDQNRLRVVVGTGKQPQDVWEMIKYVIN
jgi:adenylate kinase